MLMRNDTSVYCFFPRLGTGGGGKIKAIYHRLNAVSTMDRMRAVLINLTHNVNQQAVFAELQEKGALAADVEHLSLFEACADHLTARHAVDPLHLPSHDAAVDYGDRIEYVQNGAVVAEERTKPSPTGPITVRREFIGGEVLRVTRFLNGHVYESQYRKSKSARFYSYYVAGRRVASMFYEGDEFRYGLNYINGRRYMFFRRFQQSFVKYALNETSLTFLDGITTAYLSSAIRTPKALFLHADHRAPDGTVVPRSKSLIEGFDGEVIVTTTEVHKARLTEDLSLDTPIAIIPHVITPPTPATAKRKNLCTVSRLELEGKPIHEAIAAFARIKDDIPDVDYHIYGSGAGQKALERCIADLDCTDRVKLMGYTHAPTEVFQGALASLYPTLTEGFGLAILESLACACPVITYDVDYGPREMIQPRHNGALVTPGDIDALANAILDTVANAETYSRQCLDGIERYGHAAYLQNYAALVETYTDPANARPRHKIRPSASDDFLDTLAEEIAPLAQMLDTSGTPRDEMLDTFMSGIDENWDLARESRLLMEGYVRACDVVEDLDGVYRALQELVDLKSMDNRPVRRMIWVTRTLGDLNACQDHLLDFQDRFPEEFDDFIKNKRWFKKLLGLAD